MDKSELARTLEIPSSQRRELRTVLSQLERDGHIVIGKKSRYVIRGCQQVQLDGTLRYQPNGNAWFFPDLSNAGNLETGFDIQKYDRIFVESRDIGASLDGDKVRVKILRIGPPKWKQLANKGKEITGRDDEAAGKVMKVLERTSTNIIGIYREEGRYCFVEPDSPGFNRNIDLTDVNNAEPGQLVAVEITDWSHPDASPVGIIKHVIGWPGTPGVDIVSVIHKHNLRTDFPEEVVKEAQAVSETIPAEELARREDWREELVITIDPIDAKDHDDAVLVKETQTGWQLAVHIADVSHYVRPDSKLDKEAQLRGNSTYLVDRVLPMLPEQLSNNICSLRPGVDRLTKCAIIDFDLNGNRVKARFVDAVINSKAKLAYEEAQAILKNGGGGEIGKSILTAWKLADILRKKRFADGALDLDFPEVKVILDETTKKPIEVKKLAYDESHQLIEEFMLAANEAVAVELKRRNKMAIHRVHEDPDQDRLQEFAEIARIHGFKVGDLTNRHHVQQLLNDAKGHDMESSIKLGLLKSLKRADYRTEAFGHYGLAKMDYCHFTSPIRRYADLVVHRALQDCLKNRPSQPDRVPKMQTLTEVAQHISDTERNSAEAENATKKMKMMEYFWICSQEKPPKHFPALITDIRHMGLFVEIIDMQVKGLVKPQDIPGSTEWTFDPGTMRYLGDHGAEIRLGQKVEVEILRVDIERQLVDFRIAGTESDTYPERAKRPFKPQGRRPDGNGGSSNGPRKSSGYKSSGPSKNGGNKNKRPRR